MEKYTNDLPEKQSLVLVNSTFITEKRDPSSNRFCRLDIYKYMLKSISKITFSHVYFFIKLDDEFIERKEELEQYIRELFIKSEIHIEFTRFECHKDWKPFIENLCKKFPLTQPIYFTQNDDHIFVDDNEDILQEGLNLMKNDTMNPFKTLYLSHWTELLRLSGVEGLQTRVGNYVRFPSTFIDSIQIFTLAYLQYIFCLIPSDLCLRQTDFFLRYSLYDNPHITDASCTLRLQYIYVPLKEQCRKFNSSAGIHDVCPQLVLSHEENIKLLQMTPTQLHNYIYANLNWSSNKSFVVPDEWMQTILKLYGF